MVLWHHALTTSPVVDWHLTKPEMLLLGGASRSVFEVMSLRNKAPFLTAMLVVASLLAGTSLWARTPAKQTSKKASVKKTKSKRHVKKSSWRNRGQKTITDDRTREIQSALAREGYFDGEPTGEMDQQTKASLQKYQADNGWQTKIIPDSRALIKLGLGPDQSNVINPATAALASPMAITPAAAVAGVGNTH